MKRPCVAAAAVAALLVAGCSQTDGSGGFASTSGAGTSGTSSGAAGLSRADDARNGVDSSGGGVSIEPTPRYRSGAEPGTLSDTGRNPVQEDSSAN
jgi:hypothetical protein